MVGRFSVVGSSSVLFSVLQVCDMLSDTGCLWKWKRKRWMAFVCTGTADTNVGNTLPVVHTPDSIMMTICLYQWLGNWQSGRWQHFFKGILCTESVMIVFN